MTKILDGWGLAMCLIFSGYGLMWLYAIVIGKIEKRWFNDKDNRK